MTEENNHLIELARKGDRDAFRQIVDLFAGRVNAIAYRISGDSDEAHDIAQEVFLRLFGTLDRYDGRCSLGSWIYRMTVNMAIDFHRKHVRRKEVTYDPSISEHDPRSERQTTARDIENRETVDTIRRLCNDLPPKLRKVFILRDLEDLRTDEVADILGMKQSTVRVHLAKARARVKKALLRHHPELVPQGDIS